MTQGAVLDVISVISNPQRYARRYELYREFEKYMLSHNNIRLTTVELAYGERPYEVTSSNNERHVQVRTREELWHKENIWNIGFQHLPSDAKYVAMVDADIKFVRPDWVEETIQQLQHYPVVQPFSRAAMLGPDHVPTPYQARSFCCAYQQSLPSFDPAAKGGEFKFGDDYGGTPEKTGLAWAYRKEVLDQLGGLMDRCIIGSADYHMAAAFIGQIEQSIPKTCHGAYRKYMMDWQANAFPIVQGRIGYVNGMVYHFWHGKMKDRRYGERWNIVKEFDPYLHLQYDWSNKGVLMLSHEGRKTDLLRHLQEYFRLRNEDSIDE